MDLPQPFIDTVNQLAASESAYQTAASAASSADQAATTAYQRLLDDATKAKAAIDAFVASATSPPAPAVSVSVKSTPAAAAS